MTRACTIPATGVLPPARTLVAVRAIAPVAGNPPNSGEAMFAAPEYVFKIGEVVVKNGKVVKVVQGATHVVRPDYDKSIEKPLNSYFDRYGTVRLQNFKLADDEIVRGDKGSIIVQPTRARAA